MFVCVDMDNYGELPKTSFASTFYISYGREIMVLNLKILPQP